MFINYKIIWKLAEAKPLTVFKFVYKILIMTGRIGINYRIYMAYLITLWVKCVYSFQPLLTSLKM